MLDVLLALALGNRGDPREGMRTLQARLNKGDESTLVRAAAALLELRRNRNEDAHKHLDAIFATAPEDALAWYIRGLAFSYDNDFANAVDALGHAVIAAPEWLDARLTFGYLLIRGQQTNPALQVLQNTAEAWPTVFVARYRLGSLYKLLVDQIRYQLAASAESPRPPHIPIDNWQRQLQGFRAQVRDIASLAHAEYIYALSLRPWDQRTMWQLAEVLRVIERGDEAVALLDTLAAREPSSWIYPYRAGSINLALDRPVDAVSALVRAHHVKPDQADVLKTLGQAYLRLGEDEIAAWQLELANAFEPFNPAVYHNLGVARARLNDIESAERAWQRGLELRTFPLPRTHLTHTNLAILYYRDGRLAQARHAVDRALFTYPDFEPAMALRTALDAEAQIATEFVLHDQREMFGEISTISTQDLRP